MAQVRYIVNDVQQSISFYVDQLGFSLVQQFGSAMAIVSLDNLSLWLAGPNASASKPMTDGRQPSAGSWNRIVVTVDDLQAQVEKLSRAGIVFLNEPITGPGGTQILCEDPSGNVVELFQVPDA